MARNSQKEIYSLFRAHAISYHPDMAQIFGINAALILGQLLYWRDRASRADGWVYKTIADLERETALSRSQQDKTIKVLLKHNVIEMKLMGIPAKRHFKVRMGHLAAIIPRLLISNKLDGGKGTLPLSENSQTITETTKNITALSTAEILKQRYGYDKQPSNRTKSIIAIEE